MTAEPSVAALCALLDEHRDELHAVSGVVGTAVGTATSPNPAAAVVIQVFARSHRDVETIRLAAKALLGAAPFEIAVAGDPEPI